MFNGHSHGGIMSNFVLKHRNIETHGATGMLFVLTPGCPLLLALRIPAVANPVPQISSLLYPQRTHWQCAPRVHMHRGLFLALNTVHNTVESTGHGI